MFEAVSRLLRHPPAGIEPPVPVAPPVEIRKPYRPKIGLALGGGSARGWAHIGVMRALAEAGIEPDIIAGTSIGAVVGGCAVGGRLTELEAFARSITKRGMLHLMDFSLSGKGLITGNRLGNLLAEHLGEARVEDMPKNFTAVATELGTGHEIWLSSGNLVEAIRASYALPGIFTPIRVGGRWLVDGALVNPVPVSVCRAFGARFVIAINLAMDSFGKGSVIHQHTVLSDHNPEAPAEETRAGKKSFLRKMVGGDTTGLPGIPGVMMDAFNIIQDRITRARLAGDPPDLMVGPKLNKIGLFEFHRAAEAIDAGYEATRRQTEDIREMLAALA